MLRHTQGILPKAVFAKERGFKKIYIPEINSKEANLIKDLEIIPVKNLAQLAMHLSGKEQIPFIKGKGIDEITDEDNFDVDMAFIKGQEHIKRALEIAASGAHNVLMSGPPGAGKTLLAKTMPSILPPITPEEALEVTKIYSISGNLPNSQPLITRKPFRSPHHSSSQVALVGGGQFPRPGEITLAHRGVLFLDELPEFPQHVLEALRGPLEDGVVTISRAQMSLTFPARFTLIASQNPCPCGYLNDPEKECRCAPSQISNYKKKISGPLLDRIDMHIEVPRVKIDKLTSEQISESSKEIRKRVQKAREIQQRRFKKTNLLWNGEMKPQHIKEFCEIDKTTLDLLKTAVNRLHLSARAYHKVLKIGRTIADLAGEEKIQTAHIAEALQYRPKEE
jgi:magnesium chelatase family protein